MLVKDFLRPGRENAVPSRELAALCGCGSVRELQSEIAKERAAGEVILSSTAHGGGYYLPGNEDEVLEFIATLSRRAGNTFAALRSARAYLDRMPGQQKMEEV